MWAFFWETLYPQLAKQFRVLMVFSRHIINRAYYEQVIPILEYESFSLY